MNLSKKSSTSKKQSEKGKESPTAPMNVILLKNEVDLEWNFKTDICIHSNFKYIFNSLWHYNFMSNSSAIVKISLSPLPHKFKIIVLPFCLFLNALTR